MRQKPSLPRTAKLTWDRSFQRRVSCFYRELPRVASLFGCFVVLSVGFVCWFCVVDLKTHDAGSGLRFVLVTFLYMS